MYVVHLKHQKHNDESENRRSRLSSASFSSQDDASRLHVKPTEHVPENVTLGTTVHNVRLQEKQRSVFPKDIESRVEPDWLTGPESAADSTLLEETKNNSLISYALN